MRGAQLSLTTLVSSYYRFLSGVRAFVLSGGKAVIDDNSLEFDMFEDMRRRLVEVLVSEGRERIDAEKIALYVVQGMREMPKFVKMLSESRSHSRSAILTMLKLVLENASALEKARIMLFVQGEASAS
jgi:hypothetical protein